MTTAERITPAKPEADYRLDAYRFEWVQLGISLMLDRIHEDRGRIAADLTFYTEDAAGTKALALAPVRIENLMAPTWKRNIRQDLEARQPNTDWQAVIEQAVMLTVTRWRQGNPFIDLGQVGQRPQGRFLLDPYLEYGQPTVVFADGGCIAGDSLLEGPDGAAPIASLVGRPVRVWALDRTGAVVAAAAEAPFLKGWADLYRFTLEGGESITVTADHRFLTIQGWQFAANVGVGGRIAVSGLSPRESTVALSPQGSLTGGRRCSEIVSDSTGRCSSGSRRCDQQPRLAEGSVRVAAPSLSDVLGRTQLVYETGGSGLLQGHSHPHQPTGHPSRSGFFQAEREPVGAGCRALSCETTLSLANSPLRSLSLGASDLRVPSAGSCQAVGTLSAGDLSLPYTPPWIKHSTVTAIRYVGRAAYYDLHVPGYENYLANGIWHHNTGKSVMMLAALATVATGIPLLGITPAETGPALLLDWESDEYTHNERLAALLRPRGLTIGDMAHRVYYRREMASLPESAPTIRRFVAEHGIKVVGIDSIGFATMGEEGRAGVVQMYNALRSFGVTSWLNDHIGKGKDVNPGRPYGSIYTHDGARRTFRLDALSEPGAETTLLSVTNHKGNNTGLSQRIGLELRITTADDKSWLTAEYSTRNVLDSPELAAKGSTRDTLLALLRERNGRWVTAKDLHEEVLGLMPKDQAPSLDTVRKTLQRGRDSAKPVFASRGVGAGTEWALSDRHDEPYWAD